MAVEGVGEVLTEEVERGGFDGWKREEGWGGRFLGGLGFGGLLGLRFGGLLGLGFGGLLGLRFGGLLGLRFGGLLELGFGGLLGLGGLGDFGFVVAEGAEDDGIGGEGVVAIAFEGCPDPVGEVGLAAAFEFKEAAGQGIGSGGQGKVGAEVGVLDLFVFIHYMCRLQPHASSCCSQG